MKMKLVTVKEAAANIDGLTEYMIRKMIKEDKLASVSGGGKILVSEGEIIRIAFGEESFEYKTYTKNALKN